MCGRISPFAVLPEKQNTPARHGTRACCFVVPPNFGDRSPFCPVWWGSLRFRRSALYARSGTVLPGSLCAGFQPGARSLKQREFRYCCAIFALSLFYNDFPVLSIFRPNFPSEKLAYEILGKRNDRMGGTGCCGAGLRLLSGTVCADFYNHRHPFFEKERRFCGGLAPEIQKTGRPGKKLCVFCENSEKNSFHIRGNRVQ